LLCQLWQVLAAVGVVLVAAVTLVVAVVLVASLVAVLAPRQLSTAAAFEQHRLYAAAVHTLPEEALAD
jgi:hypothetical protein